jgi:long-chain fatty acid transport protein
MKLKVLGSLGLMVLGGGAQAAGFSLLEQNGSGLGSAFAGQAAVASDASTVFFNPAGMNQLQGTQISLAGDYVSPSAKFSGSATPAFSTATGGDAGKAAVVPSFYLVTDILSGLKFGLGVNAPFGMMTEYDFPWAGMTQAVKSELTTLNVNPSLAWAVNDRFSLGLGVNWQSIDAELSSYKPGTGIVAMKGNDNNWGWNVGALFKLDQASRIGLSYRSQVDYRLEGTLAGSTPVTADITMPDSASLSYFRTLSPTWDVLADVSWMGWSTFNELRVKTLSGATAQLVDESWKNTMRYSLGVNFHQNDRLMWRFGVAYDETPVPDAAHRTPRIPDENRTWVSVGGQYRMTPKTTADFGYAHLFVNDAAINHTEPGNVLLTGTYSNSVDIVGVQVNHTF